MPGARKNIAQGALGVGLNPLQVALLRWYDANTAGHQIPAGPGPYGLAFDGDHLWVGNSTSNTVSKLRASDGANLGTFAVGSIPVPVAFDGVSIWVAAQFGNSVSKF